VSLVPVTATGIAMTFDYCLTCLPAAVASTVADPPGAVALPECVDAAFADLVYADDDWVRDEFDAIIAESFDEPPRNNPRPQGWWPPHRPAHRQSPCGGEMELAAGHETCGEGGRQRAPPHRSPQQALVLKPGARSRRTAPGFPGRHYRRPARRPIPWLKG
jgi:hypothetical protein